MATNKKQTNRKTLETTRMTFKKGNTGEIVAQPNYDLFLPNYLAVYV